MGYLRKISLEIYVLASPVGRFGARRKFESEIGKEQARNTRLGV